MTKYFAVTRERGPGWDMSVPMRNQNRWKDHAAFMDDLAEGGFIVVGGPVGTGDRTFLFLVKAESQEEIEERLAADPWALKMLRTSKIEPWEILLGKLA